MIQIKNISKKYVTGGLVQGALDDVTFNLRDNEFVAVLGQSGSGKTTLLNIIGGLDRYDSGDIIINNVSTKKYNDRDWDSYRNHTIGFVFQSYNLIPHQTILANVELALTISGISKAERKRLASKALEEVGLGDQLHKKPNQMSGGQMQRVAIARALVNDPDILLADEPTGALDSETSIQVMDLLKEVAKDRLVVMVTHNPDLADEYANRIIKLHDGKIVNDTNPFVVDESKLEAPKHKNLGKASMSFATALSLSFNNLRTKKARTLLTAFAGSIGIIGISLILSLSNGVNKYITDIQKDTMVSYPITIAAQSFDLSSLMEADRNFHESSADELDHELDAVYSDATTMELASSITTSISENNLTEFKKYLDNPDSEIHQYVGSNGIDYSYDISFTAYSYDPNGKLVNTDGTDFKASQASGMGGMMGNMSSFMPANMMAPTNLTELLSGAGDELISAAVKDNNEVLFGKWPEKYDEVVFLLNANNEVNSSALYELGLLPAEEYDDILNKIQKGEDVEIKDYKLSYEEICDQVFYLVPACDFYTKKDDGLFEYVGDDIDKVKALVENSVQLKIVGVVRSNEDSNYTMGSASVGYTKALSNYIIDYTNDSDVVKAQEESPDVNIINGLSFIAKTDEEKIKDTIEYLKNLTISEKAIFAGKMMSDASTAENHLPEDQEMPNPEAMQQEGYPEGYAPDMSQISQMGEAELAAMLDQYLQNPEDMVVLEMYNTYISSGSYDDNMTAFGVVSWDAPSSINIYTDSFEDKDLIGTSIENYNKTVSTENQISYTDLVGLLMSSVTTIINVISYVLIAFVALSLVVSSIMIGIITFISVLERTKEIGILRAIGASKRNISQVFNAETFIIGLISGIFGVGLSSLLLVPINAIIHMAVGSTDVNAILPLQNALVLVALSLVLTLISGVLPSRKAARKDPVIALRSE